MFIYTKNDTESDKRIRNTNLWYKAHQQYKNTCPEFQHVRNKLKNRKRRRKEHFNLLFYYVSKFHNSYFVCLRTFTPRATARAPTTPSQQRLVQHGSNPWFTKMTRRPGRQHINWASRWKRSARGTSWGPKGVGSHGTVRSLSKFGIMVIKYT